MYDQWCSSSSYFTKMKRVFSKENTKDNEMFSLPVGPSDLCFDRHDFIEKSFSADSFLHDHKKRANFETIRDDLGAYLKILRSALIELINKDYADFVNLSSNLIGLDKAIHSIQVPLGQLKEEVLQVKQILDDSMCDVSAQLSQRRLLHLKKHTLKSVSCAQNVLHKLGYILDCAQKPIVPDLIERSASEYNQLQFAISKCDAYKTESIVQKTQIICNILTSNLNKRFLESFKSRDTTEIIHCLRIYVMLECISYVEDLFRKEVVSVALADVICNNAVNTNPNGLQGIYSLIFNFIEEDMKDILEVTRGGNCQVHGFDFLVNSLWPEVERRLEINLSSIYAPGNPEIFYTRYCETMNFLKQLDKYFSSPEHVMALHSHPQYKAFLEHWNLPVYFQIRFQEIAGYFETAVCDKKCTDILTSHTTDFHVSASLALWNCLMQCWADGVYLIQLGHRFWKLSLQLLARYSVWISKVLKEGYSVQSPSENSGVTQTKNVKDNDTQDKIKFFVHLYMDLQTLEEKIPCLEEMALRKLQCLSTQNQAVVQKSFYDSKQQICNNLPIVSQAIVDGICEESLLHLRQVSDIPRLFRRTNRETPSKPCAYVAQVLAPSVSFMTSHSDRVQEHLMSMWLSKSFSSLTANYYSAVSDVLTSVQKTEESLRRLKKLRDRVSSAPSVETRGSDDDKIRKQLVLDVQSYSDGILEIGLKKETVLKLDDLLKLVSEASNAQGDTK